MWLGSLLGFLSFPRKKFSSLFSVFHIKWKFISLALYLHKSHFWEYKSKCCKPIRLQHSQISYIPRKIWRINLNYWILIYIQETQKMVCRFLVGWVQTFSQPIRMQNSWISSISSKKWWIYTLAWLKIHLANQIARFINQPYLKMNQINHHSFLHADTDWRKLKGDLKIVVGWVRKYTWPVRLQNS